MSHAVNIHDGTGHISKAPNVGILDAFGTTVPADATAGYATGCTFRHTDGGDSTALYINEGTNTSCSFRAVTAATQGAALTAAHATLTQAGTDSGDVAIQAMTSSTPFGFANAAEGEAVIACVLNAMVRLGEIEARLEAAGIVASN